MSGKIRKPVKVVKRGQLSPFQNYDYVVELECGHTVWTTKRSGDDPMRHRYLCYKCDKKNVGKPTGDVISA